MKKFLFLMFFLPTAINAQLPALKQTHNGTIMAPFGFKSAEPATQTSVQLFDHKIGLSAHQTCGYTDWSSIALHMPTKLLTKSYWENLGQNLKDAAVKTALNLSGALPGMLACNVSPTYCNLLNQAELMAAFEGQLTFETCKVLDGVANVSLLQSESLRRCVAGHTGQGESASFAREKCLANAGSKKKKIDQTASQASAKTFSITALINRIFPISSQSHSTSSTNGTLLRQAYSRTVLMQLFPGVEVSGTATIQKAGSYGASADSTITKAARKIRRAIRRVLRHMNRLHKKGLHPAQIIKRIHKRLHDPKNWETVTVVSDGKTIQEKTPGPLFLTKPGQLPVLLVSLEQLLMMALQQHTQAGKIHVKILIDQLSKRLAQLKTMGDLAFIYRQSLDTCSRDPDFMSAVAQHNCKALLVRLKEEMNLLSLESDMEALAAKTQSDISMRLAAFNTGRLIDTPKVSSEHSSSSIPIPGGY